MKRVLTLIVSFVICISCLKQQPENKVSFKPELVIGENTETEGGWFSTLNSFYFTPDENIYCLDSEDRKIKVFDKTGKPLFSFGQKGQGPGEFVYPSDIAASKSGFIYILDAAQRNISKFTREGEFISSTKITDAVARFEIFDSGKLVLEIAKINMKDIKQSQYELRLFDVALREIKSSIYEKPGTHLTWVEGVPGKMFTLEIPFAPKIKWKVIGDRLYVGYSGEYKITVFDANGEYVKEITKNVKLKEVTRAERNKWIAEILERFADRPQFDPQVMEKSLKSINLPKFKPAFTHLAEISTGLVVFGNPTNEGIPGILYENDNEIDEAIFEYADFKYFYGKYYRITGGGDTPFTLTRYQLIREDSINN